MLPTFGCPHYDDSTKTSLARCVAGKRDSLGSEADRVKKSADSSIGSRTLSSRGPYLEDLELLLDVTRVGSLGRAAQLHHISQPAASARISRLERLLRIRILERLPSGSRLTTEGTVVANWARNILEAVESLLSSAAALAAHQEVRLRIASSRTIAEYLLPPWLTALHDASEQLTVALTVSNSEECLDALRRGEVDIVLVSLKPEPPLETRVIGRSELVVVVSPQHPWATEKKVVSHETLAGMPMLVRERGTGTRAALEKLFKQNGSPMPDLVEIPSPAALKAAVMTSNVPAVISSLSVERELMSGTLRKVPIEQSAALQTTLYAAWQGPDRDGRRAQLLSVILRSKKPTADGNEANTCHDAGHGP